MVIKKQDVIKEYNVDAIKFCLSLICKKLLTNRYLQYLTLFICDKDIFKNTVKLLKIIIFSLNRFIKKQLVIKL